VYPDVPVALRRWHAAGRRAAIYSSGDVLAQRLLFASTSHGDLTGCLHAYFDTAVGAKTDPGSYATIAELLACDPREIVFVSDVTRELQAAASAGLHTRLSVRPGNDPQSDADTFTAITSLDELP
jgi:2,3-diketo-5-methylthio-1-phosphopentane phosphatase